MICCTPEQAAQWMDGVLWLALRGDAEALAALPGAVEHWLISLR